VRILFVAPYVPSRIRVRALGWIRALAARGDRVHLVAIAAPDDHPPDERMLRETCERVDLVRIPRMRTVWNVLAALPGRTPLQAAYSRHPEAEARIRQLLSSDRFDVLHVEHLRAVLLAVGATGAPRVWDAVDSIAALFEQAASLAPSPGARLVARLDLARTRELERRMLGTFDRTVVTAAGDAGAFRALDERAARARVDVIPNGVSLDYFQPRPERADRATVVFTGKLSYHANVAAGLHLATRIMPLVWRGRPDSTLVLAGSDPPGRLRALGRDPRIHVTGFVPDLRPVFDRATVAAVPIVYGAGIQNKLLEAMASGVPVVASPRAAAPFSAQAPRDLAIARDDEAFAAALVSFIDDRRLRERVGLAGRAYVEAHHDWMRLVEELATTYDRARAGSVPATPAAF
jgi:glycosyltransferase involved in cell wall biosynthesis